MLNTNYALVQEFMVLLSSLPLKPPLGNSFTFRSHALDDAQGKMHVAEYIKDFATAIDIVVLRRHATIAGSANQFYPLLFGASRRPK